MNTTTVYNAINGASIQKACEYSESPDILRDILLHCKIEYRLLGCFPYFPEDKENRNVLDIAIMRNNKSMIFRFGMSINDSNILNGVMTKYNKTAFYGANKKEKILDNILYGVLTCLKSDYLNNASFSDFCSEFGYDEDSRKAYGIYVACLEQTSKIKGLFNETELRAFPS